MKNLFLLAVLTLAPLLRGEPIEVTRQQASDLLVSLMRIEAGLSPENVVIGADNINALRPFVEALDKGKVRAQRDIDALPKGDDQLPKAWAIRERIEAKGDEVVKVDLTRMDVSPDEIKAAHVKMADLAPLRQFLKPKK